jgi:hypothetical protein
MNSRALVLACLFLPLQTVYYLDCCCGELCTHKNECNGCQDETSASSEAHPGHLPDRDCCKGKPQPASKHSHSHKKLCAHLSPSTEITIPSSGTWVHPPVGAELLLPAAELLRSLPGLGRGFLTEHVPRPASDIPRHLLLSVLQV